MSAEFIGFTFDLVGKIMVSLTALMVHYRFRKEHKVDSKVFKIMQIEHCIGIIGINFIILGYFLQLESKLL